MVLKNIIKKSFPFIKNTKKNNHQAILKYIFKIYIQTT